MKVQGIIFDWAGTTIDYGCFSPVEAFINAFKKVGIEITFEEAREPMGMLKIDHTRALLQMERIRNKFCELNGRFPTEKDVKDIYDKFEPALFSTLKDYIKLNPYVKEAIDKLKEMNIKIGSTTGYTREMMEVVIPVAKEIGYDPECCVTSDELGYGRPYPYMMYECARRLNIYPQKTVMKVGDTVVDMKEGVNSGAWTVGVVLGSSELGLTYEEVQSMNKEELSQRMEKVRKTLYSAGADYVIDDMRGLIDVIEDINKKLS